MRLRCLVACLFLGAGCGEGQPTRSGDERYEASGTVLESPEHEPELCLGGLNLSLPPQCRGVPLVGWDWSVVEGKESAGGTTWASVRVVGTYDGERFTLTEAPGRPREGAEPEDPRFTPLCADPDVIDPSQGVAVWEEAVGGEGGARNNAIPGLVASWVNGPSGPDWDGPFLVNLVVRPGSAAEAKTFVRGFWRGALCIEERDQPTVTELDAMYAKVGEVLGTRMLLGNADYRRGVVLAKVVLVDDELRREVEEAVDPKRVELRSALRRL